MLLTSEATLKGSNKAYVCLLLLPTRSEPLGLLQGWYVSLALPSDGSTFTPGPGSHRRILKVLGILTVLGREEPHLAQTSRGACFQVCPLPTPTQVCYMYSQLLHQAQTREKASRGNRCLLLGGGGGGDGLGHLEVQALRRAGRENNNVRGRCWLLCNWPTPWHKP